MVGLLATLLDPQLKTLSSCDQKTQEKAKADNNIRHNRLYSSIFGMSTSTYTASNPLAKLECYLDPTQTPIAEDISNAEEYQTGSLKG
ncbi:11955_t:CDS:2 [Cetraspora pellucida]|uniref:11955_t:CDS:1 n=1 Tax=Cetraspora pellucida TaxID=1433469 RepID=A0ACA9N3V0_9GLOM|nr:11955_t:CDS:2 [Cetraspora pellucida]